MSITAPASPNTLLNAVPDAGNAGKIGGRSNPVTGNIRCYGDNLNTATPGTLYNNDLANPTGSANTPSADPLCGDISNEVFGVLFNSRKCKDSETAADPHAKPAHIG